MDDGSKGSCTLVRKERRCRYYAGRIFKYMANTLFSPRDRLSGLLKNGLQDGTSLQVQMINLLYIHTQNTMLRGTPAVAAG
jgi:hypothetical protein